MTKSIHPHAQEYPDTSINHYQYSKVARSHPLVPYLILAIHLAYHSQVAATLFVDQGILQLVKRLWLYDFPDPFRLPLTSHDRLVLRAEMRVGCILFLGALARHHSDAHDLADHLLSLGVITPAATDDWTSSMSVFSPASTTDRTGHYLGVYKLASATHPDSYNAIPPLTLFLMETCVANCVPLTCGKTYLGHPWRALLALLRRTDINHYCGVLKDTAARVFVSCASMPEEYWKPLLDTLCTWDFEESHAALCYIVHQFLHPSGDPASISRENREALRRLYKKAASRGLEIVNPVDRFILLLHRATASPHFTSVLRDVGIAGLLKFVSLGLYDFLGDESATPLQKHVRDQTCTAMLHKIDRPLASIGEKAKLEMYLMLARPDEA